MNPTRQKQSVLPDFEGRELKLAPLSLRLVAALAIPILLAAPALRGGGLRTLPDSARTMGMVGGRLATLDDASVVRTNPATLGDLLGTEAQVNIRVLHGKGDFDGAFGGQGSMIDPWKLLGSVHLPHPVDERLAFGLGISALFGIAVSWEPDGPFRYTGAHEASLRTLALNPDAALAEMARTARPGGTVAVADLDGQLQGFDPLEPWLADELAVALAHLRGQGFDPDAGCKVRGRFLQAGLREVRVSVLTHQLYAGPMPEGERANWNLKLEVGCERIACLACLDGDAPRWRRFAAAMRELFEREDFIYHSRLVLVSGRTADC